MRLCMMVARAWSSLTGGTLKVFLMCEALRMALVFRALPTQSSRVMERSPVIWGSMRMWREDGFIALNTAFISDGAFIEVEENASVESPLHLVFVSTDGAQTVSHPRVLVVAGRGSSATIVESYVGVPGNRCLTNSVAEIVLEDDATLDHYRLLMESEDAFHVGVAGSIRALTASITPRCSSGRLAGQV